MLEKAPIKKEQRNKSLADIFKSVDRNASIPAMRGFYVMRMKKDERTGHYFGVATWISKNQPLPGRGVAKTPEPVQKVDLEDYSKSEHFPAKLEEHVAERAAQIEDSSSEFNQTVERLRVERRPSKSTFFESL